MAGITQKKQKALFSLWSLNKNYKYSRNIVVSSEKNITILITVTKLIIIK